MADMPHITETASVLQSNGYLLKTASIVMRFAWPVLWNRLMHRMFGNLHHLT